MKEFKYVIKDQQGIHARPAGLLVKEAGAFQCKVSIIKAEKEVDAKRIFGIMGLGVKCGEEITVRVDGVDESNAFDTLNNFFEANL